MPKNKPNKGLLKRIRISKNGKIKMHRAAGRHLRSHKSSKRLRGYRRNKYAAASDVRRIQSMLFGCKRSAKPATASGDEGRESGEG